MYKVKCIPQRVLFANPLSEYKVLSCVPDDPSALPEGFELSQYGSFTINGSNLMDIALNIPIELNLREDTSSKYPASYVLIGIAAFSLGGERISVNEEDEYNLLCQFMTPSQANYVHQAYPHFIEMVLNGEEEKIEHKNIHNVGKFRYEEYCQKVKENYKTLLYLPVASKYGIEDKKTLEKLMESYATAKDFEVAMDENPYRILCNVADFSFSKADKYILKNNPSKIDSLERCSFGCYYILKENELEGDTRLNANILARLAKDMIPECSHHILEAVKNNPLIYYDEESKDASVLATYENEKYIGEQILQRVENPIDFEFDWKKFKKIEGFVCTNEQSEILRLASEKNVAILNGSAGSGKSACTKALIKMLDHYDKSYLLLAPTGVAAKRLSQATGRSASTIHLFLTRHPEETYDYVLIDEYSMVGVNLFASLLRNINNDAKLILVCDEAQLASISCGNLIQDMLESKIVPTANLTKVFRYGEGGIATIATDTRHGILSKRQINSFEDYLYFESKSPMSQIIGVYENLLNQGYKSNEILILCPFNKSPIGTYTINNTIQEKFNTHLGESVTISLPTKQTMSFKVGDKIINTKNNYHATYLDLNEDGEYEPCGTVPIMNGDIGYVRAIIKDPITSNLRMVAEFDCGMVGFEGAEFGNLLLGYAISVHKSQGTQAKVVIVVLTKTHKNMMSRNLLYVAESRAQEKLIEIVDMECVEAALKIEENKNRNTWLKSFLKPLDK